MLFNSLQFIIFFPLVVYVYFLIAPRFRWVFLLVASYYFYMCWRPEYVLLIVISTFIDYYAAIKIGEAAAPVRKRAFLLLSLATNLGILFAFKYFNFFNASARAVFEHFNLLYNVPELKVLLPIGISFYTFQTLSYTIDVYRGHRPPERHFGVFAVYVAFFPQLVAGPIERSTSLLPQFHKANTFDWERTKDGLRQMLWGYFKKIVLADNLAVFVDKVYGAPMDFHGGTLLLATYFFAFQIYYDFAGYSDIAVGAARVMGYDLMINFRQPYLSRSVQEFWQRWHISLSSWFKDYLYIPLGGNRVTAERWIWNIAAVFLLSGLWHGAKWTFVIWGALHGLYYVVGHFISPAVKLWRGRIFPGPRDWLCRLGAMFAVFHLVCFAWIFFRAASVGDAFYITHKVLTGGFGWDPAIAGLPGMSFFLFLAGLIAVSEIGAAAEPFVAFHPAAVRRLPQWGRWAVYYTVIVLTLVLGNFNAEQFIYFQF